jgi:predicted AAA+ superfamily ATPase
MITIDKLNDMNQWWKTDSVKKELSPIFKRKLYYTIQKYINLRQITAIVGLRRTGKSTLFYQLIEELIENKNKSQNILYFSFDETISELSELINFYKENILKKDLGDGKIFIFLDEIQKLKDWENKIKIYYDLYPNIKFFVSGSASINIIMNSKESLAGRIFYFHLEPLSFEEFLQLKGKDIGKIKENPSLWKSELKIEINEYLLKPFPEIINADDDLAKKYIKESIIEKAIFRDLSTLFEIKDIGLIENLINIVASNPGMIINLDDLSKDLKRNRQIISNYLYYLEYCFILKSLKNFRGSLKVS